MARYAVQELITGFIATQALHAASKLAIFDALSARPMTASEIASAVGCNEENAGRLLRFLTSVDVLHEDENERFTLTKEGETLCSDHPASMRAWALLFGEPFIWNSWGRFEDAIRYGKPGFDCAYGQRFFDYLNEHPVDSAIFNAAMSSSSGHECAAILASYDFSGISRIADIGGGQGTLLRGILEQYPDARGLLCDLPSVVSGANDGADANIVARCECVGINFFESVPPGCDIYILKKIVHDWNDAQVTALFRNCRQAMSRQGRILVVESIVQSSNEADPAKWKDLNMLALVTGRERTAEEFHGLLDAAGFQVTRILGAGSLSIIEAAPKP